MEHASIVAALTNGSAFGVPATKVQRIDTLAAHVFLVGDRAYKLKRPVALSVLDFTRQEARRRALKAEQTLNRRFAPQLYLGLVEIQHLKDGYSVPDLGATETERGTGEWLLVMRRFPEAARLDHVAARGDFTPELAERTGARLAGLHAALPALREAGGSAAFADVLAGNRSDFAKAHPALFDADRVGQLADAADAALAAHAELMDARRDAGHVRHCHGDLHLANIVLLEGEPTPFDCIEFSAEIARIDVLYDLAFLVMDLSEQGHRFASQRVLQGYVDAAGIDRGLALLPLFLSTRAAIRAKVLGLVLAALPGGLPEAHDPRVLAARRYLGLADRLLRPPQPCLVAVGGLSGTGKTTVARNLAPSLGPAPGAILLRSDIVRKQQFGVPAHHRLPAAAYTPTVSEAVFAELRDRAARMLKAGHTVVVDAVHSLEAERAAIEAVADAAGVRFYGIWLEGDVGALKSRVMERIGDASDADAAVVDAQAKRDHGALTWARVSCMGTPRRIALNVRRLIDPRFRRPNA